MTWEAEARLRIAREQIMAVIKEGIEGFDSAAGGLDLRHIASEIEAFAERLASHAPRLDDSIIWLAKDVRKTLDATRPNEVFAVKIHVDDALAFLEAMGLDSPEGIDE